MNAICLVIDRLHAGYLGAYGNSWIATPVFDRLACDGFVFDHALSVSPRLEDLYRSYWQGWHPMCPGEPPEDRPSLAERLDEAGVETALLTDERSVLDHPLALQFDELLDIDPPWEPRPAEGLESTHLARCFAQAISWLGRAEGPFLLWCHLGGLGTAWDGPAEFRRRYWEEGDPQPPGDAEVPDRILPEDHDPDEVLAAVQSYAGQVTLLDTCLGALVEHLDESPAGRETLLVVAAARGFPLGEHRRLGPCDAALYGELVHVPLLVRMPGGVGAAGRSQALIEPADLWATLLDAWGIDPRSDSHTGTSLLPIIREEAVTLRDRVCLLGDGVEQAIRTPAWHLRCGAGPELFAKPDDRWEANDVARRCPEVVECLEVALEQYRAALRSGTTADLPPLGEVLLSGLE
jgi:arylsulfatase A-like enzyme